jgi:trigger factor
MSMKANVNVENLGPCKKLLRVEVAAEAVESVFEEITREFMKHARLPGFRHGKAPRHLILKAFSSSIEKEARQRLISESYREGIREQKLHVVGQPDIEEIQFGRGQPLHYAATVETAPDFELPEYKGLPVKREVRLVTPEDIERALDVLREQRATYLDVARPVQLDDYVVVHYAGTCEGKRLTEIAPAARGLEEKKDFWVHVAPGSFLPGFTEQLVGAQAGEKRTVGIDFPSDFVARELAGKQGSYRVEIVQVKEKVLPELNDEFAQSLSTEDVERLRSGVRTNLEAELNYKLKRSVRDQLMRELLSRVHCELPESVVLSETRNVVYDIVRENQERGVSRESIDRQKEQIFSVANNSAKERVKAAFVLGRIADKEGIQATEEEVKQRVLRLAEQYQIKPEKMLRQLEERHGLAEIEEQIISTKVLDLLEQHARVEDVLPTSRP